MCTVEKERHRLSNHRRQQAVPPRHEQPLMVRQSRSTQSRRSDLDPVKSQSSRRERGPRGRSDVMGHDDGCRPICESRWLATDTGCDPILVYLLPLRRSIRHSSNCLCHEKYRAPEQSPGPQPKQATLIFKPTDTAATC